MATLNFIPANTVFLADSQSRQLQFSQDKEGTVEVKVFSASLQAINTVYQDNIFVQPKSELEQPEIQRLEDMSSEQRKAIMGAVENDTVEVAVQDGGVSRVKKTNNVKAVFFHTIRSITLTEK